MEQIRLNGRVRELLVQALETELGGIRLYQAALESALNPDLHREWAEYLEQTIAHRDILLTVFATLHLAPDAQSDGRRVVAHLGRALVLAIEQAQQAGDPGAAEIVAAECVTVAETRDHLNWQLIGKVAGALGGEAGEALQTAYDKVEEEEDRHLYHSKGWTRELWLRSLGLRAVMPPPEDVHDVSGAIEAAKAEQNRDRMLHA
jgi:hypothetical protein